MDILTDEAVKINCGNSVWYYKTVYDREKELEAVYLYNTEGQFVAEFLNLNDCISYVEFQAGRDLPDKKRHKEKEQEKRVLDDLQSRLQRIFMERIGQLKGSQSNHEFADRIGVNRCVVYNYVSGCRFPTVAALVNIADQCGVTVDWLLGRE